MYVKFAINNLPITMNTYEIKYGFIEFVQKRDRAEKEDP